MKKLFLLTTLLSVIALSAFCQAKYKLKDGIVSFYSYAPLEDIEAVNKKAAGIIDPTQKTFTFKINIKDFSFKSSLMQEHFNENYMESEKYPTSNYKGSIKGDFDLSKDGTYKVMTKGPLTIHGVTREVEIPATINVKGAVATIAGNFKVKLQDYKIEIPTVVYQKIAEEVDVKITSTLQLLTQ